MIRKIMFFLLGVICFAVIYFFIGDIETKHISEPSVQKPTIKVMPVQIQTKTIQRFYIGYVTPINYVPIRTSIEGFIENIAVTGGQNVQKKDLLFAINPDMYRAQLNLASAAYHKAQATLSNAQQYYQRLKNAGARAVSKTDLDNANTQVLTAQSALAEAKAQMDLAQINYNYTNVYAPIDGKIGNVNMSIGDYINPSDDPMITIIQYHPIRVLFSISDKEYLTSYIHQGTYDFNNWTVSVRLADGSMFPHAGLIQYIDNKITPETNSITVYADFDNPFFQLLPNAYVDVILSKDEKGIFIPQEWIEITDAGGFVYILNGDNRIEKRSVVLGDIVGTDRHVISGISDGDKLIVESVKEYQIGKQVIPQESAQ